MKSNFSSASSLGDVGHAFVEALEVAFENEVREAGVALFAGGFGERRAEAGELVEIALQEKHVAAVERVEIAVEKLAGQFVVELLMGELRAFENLGGERGDGGIGRLGIERIRVPEAERGDGGDQAGADREEWERGIFSLVSCF